jgi:hypothetical protein
VGVVVAEVAADERVDAAAKEVLDTADEDETAAIQLCQHFSN